MNEPQFPQKRTQTKIEREGAIFIRRVRVNRDNIRYAESVSSGEKVEGKTSEWVSPATDRVVSYAKRSVFKKKAGSE
jgi:hypothetical protein